MNYYTQKTVVVDAVQGSWAVKFGWVVSRKREKRSRKDSNHITTRMERHLQLLISFDAAHLSGAQGS
jgi:hypothetical protein